MCVLASPCNTKMSIGRKFWRNNPIRVLSLDAGTFPCCDVPSHDQDRDTTILVSRAISITWNNEAYSPSADMWKWTIVSMVVASLYTAFQSRVSMKWFSLWTSTICHVLKDRCFVQLGFPLRGPVPPPSQQFFTVLKNFKKNATWRWQWAHLEICICDMHYSRWKSVVG